MLKYFNPELTPRPQQVEVLQAVEDKIRTHDVIVIRAPVGAGKSALAECITKYTSQELHLKSTIATPTNVLVKQYLNTCTGLTPAPLRGNYDENGWQRATDDFKAADIRVCNYYTYLALRAYTPVVVVDEAHNLLRMLIELNGAKLWRHLYNYPEYMPSILHFLQWAVHADKDDKRLQRVLADVMKHPTLYTMSNEIESYRGEDKDVLKVHPLSPRNAKPVLWPRTVKKLIFMSATFGLEDVYELGLETRRVALIDVGSPIPPNRRPILFDPIGNMSVSFQSANIPKLVDYIEAKMGEHAGQKGLVHLTYSLAKKLKATRLIDNKRIIWHSKADKARKLKEWMASGSEDGAVFMACGLAEGLDVKGDLGRWQIIAKCMYPDKSDIAVAEKMKLNPDWYAYQAIRDMEQMVGRICRGEDDYGISYIVDSAFAILYEQHRDSFSVSFKEALK